MHYLHVVAVEAEDATGAVTAAEEFLSSYTDEVFDFYTIGGRWDGVLGGTNVLCAADDLDGFRRAVTSMLENRAEDLRRLRDQVTGRAVNAEEVRPFAGLPIPDPVGAAERISAGNAEMAAAVSAAVAADVPDGASELVGFVLKRLGQLLSGDYCTDSYFFDAEAFEATPVELWGRVAHDPARQWLVAVDLHS
jgi:hypothetical protein